MGSLGTRGYDSQRPRPSATLHRCHSPTFALSKTPSYSCSGGLTSPSYMMHRADSYRTISASSSIYSQEAATPKASTLNAAYRLFPSVEPTPPSTPVVFHRSVSCRTPDAVHRRSASLDEARAGLVSRNVGLRPTPLVVRRPPRRGNNNTELKPMSTVLEIALDSPTVPV